MGKQEIVIFDVTGDPETDDRSLYGLYKVDGEERTVALAHDEWAHANAGLAFTMEIESERIVPEDGNW